VSDPAVSVIVPTYQRGHLIGRALRSVLTQGMSDLEVIVVDDGSTDDTARVVADMAATDARLRFVTRPGNRGAGAARNVGLQMARGRYVAFQDSDDEWLAGKLARQFARMEALPENFALTQAAVLRFENDKVRYLFSALPAGEERTAILPVNNSTFVQAWLARRGALLEAGGFDEQLTQWEDWELMIRICQRFRVDMDAQPAAMIYDTPQSLMRQHHRRVASLAPILERHAALMQAHPGAMAINLYAMGRFHLLEGEPAKGRGFLRRSLRLNPLRLRTWALLAASLLGTAKIRAMIDWRDRTRTSPGSG